MTAEPWDKTFQKNDVVEQKKVHFTNRFGIELTGDLYVSRNRPPKAAIALCGPFGAVKEQASGLYAQKLAEYGFLTLAFDPSFTGESGGTGRFMNAPDLNNEDFMAAVDYLIAEQGMENVGILGICGWGGTAIDTAACDPRIKATVAVTMYDMGRVTQKGYFDAADSKTARAAARQAMAAQRTEDYKNKSHQLAGGVVDPLPADAPDFVKDYYAYYKTPRGYHPRSLNSNDGWAVITGISLLNHPILTWADEIDAPVMLVHGEKAHSFYFSQDTFQKLKGENKEFLIIPDASHTDLYDQTEKIPFNRITAFFEKHLSL